MHNGIFSILLKVLVFHSWILAISPGLGHDSVLYEYGCIIVRSPECTSSTGEITATCSAESNVDDCEAAGCCWTAKCTCTGVDSRCYELNWWLHNEEKCTGQDGIWANCAWVPLHPRPPCCA